MSELTSASDIQGIGSAYALSLIHRRPDDVVVATMPPLETDINFPPEAWNYDSSYASFRRHNISLDMGREMWPKTMEMNLCGNSKTVKKLIMIPFAAGTTRLVCHKVGNTVYVDETESLQAKDHKVELKEQVKAIEFPANNPTLSLYENLIWRCQSLELDNEHKSMDLALVPSHNTPKLASEFPRMFSSYSFKLQPQDAFDGEVYIWEFHDMSMMVDVNIPIFGGGSSPSVTIKLTEECPPISVLTGVDLLLDQLIAHVKHTILVRTEKGKIKDYDVVLRENIPFLIGSEFDPNTLKRITTNLLGYLSDNMAQGHTYWLTKEKDSEEVCLYDLTLLCGDWALSSETNQFLLPVLRLLWEISSQLIRDTPTTRSANVSNVIFGLLDAADNLLVEESTLSHRVAVQYQLAGLYLVFAYSEDQPVDETQEELIKGLEDAICSGYARMKTMATIKVNTLLDMSSMAEESGIKEKPAMKSSCLCYDEVLEHCLKALEALMKAKSAGIPDEKLIFCPDNADDEEVLKRISKSSGQMYKFTMSAILLRAATAYAGAINQYRKISNTKKVFSYAKAGVYICGLLMSSINWKRHLQIATYLYLNLIPSLANSMLLLSSSMECLSSYGDDHFREKTILKLATEMFTLRDSLNMTKLVDTQRTLTRNEWLTDVRNVLKKFCSNFNKGIKTGIMYPPLLSIVSDPLQLVMQVASLFLQMGNDTYEQAKTKYVKLLNSEMEPEFVKEYRELIISDCDEAICSFKLAMDVCDMQNVKLTPEFTVVLYVNSAICYKMKFKIYKDMSSTDKKSIQEFIDKVCDNYQHGLDGMKKTLETSSGANVYLNTLREFAISLMEFSLEQNSEKALNYVDKARMMLETALQVNNKKDLKNDSDCREVLRSVYVNLLFRVWKTIEITEIGQLQGRKKCLITNFLDKLKTCVELYIDWFSSTTELVAIRVIPKELMFLIRNVLQHATINERKKEQFCQLIIKMHLTYFNYPPLHKDPSAIESHIDSYLKNLQTLLLLAYKELKSNKAKKVYATMLIPEIKDQHEKVISITNALKKTLELY